MQLLESKSASRYDISNDIPKYSKGMVTGEANNTCILTALAVSVGAPHTSQDYFLTGIPNLSWGVLPKPLAWKANNHHMAYKYEPTKKVEFWASYSET